LTLGISLLAGFTRASLFPRQGEAACATASACVTFEEAADGCSDNACFCPTAIAVGPACANCFGPYNASFSSEILSIVSECSQVGTGTSTPAGGAATPTTDPCLVSNTACQTLYAAASSCADDACVCPTAWMYASACAACYKTVNATVSSDLVQALSTCAEEGYTSPGAGGASLTSKSSGGQTSLALTTRTSQSTGSQTTSGGGAVVTVKTTASGTTSGVSTATGKSSGSSREVVGLGILFMVFLGSAVTLF
jgi:hypothetical protein